jgi:hypothetical protein
MSRHLGNAAFMADRSSWITKQQRLDKSLDLWEPDTLRRKAQTEVVGDQLRQEAARKSDKKDDLNVRKALSLDVPDGEADPERPVFLESVLKPLRTKYGLRADALCPTEGLVFDPHIMAPRDPDHLLWFGIARLLLEFAYSTLSATAKDAASRRLNDFPWPSNYPRITFHLSRTIASRYSMEFTRKMFLLAVLTWQDLLDDTIFALFWLFFLLCNALLKSVMAQEDIKRVQELTVNFVSMAQKVLGDTADKPISAT